MLGGADPSTRQSGATCITTPTREEHMSDFISEYGEQLRQAGWRRLHARRFAPLMRVRPARKVAVAIVVLCVAAPAVAATVVWHPLLGDGRSSAPTSSDEPAAESQRRVLSVLRRAQQPADRGAQTRYALKFLGASVAGVRTNEIRLLHVERDGRGIVLIPVGRYGLAPAGTPPALAERLGRRGKARRAVRVRCRPGSRPARWWRLWLLQHPAAVGRASDRRLGRPRLRPRAGRHCDGRGRA